ncbi:hypothetical protein PVAG01_10615 [Phlyctema vagabunda]|uniref:Uncharacterized protein n=1 Tax=Phlyctema vagabunda TaxID=108571 RepID=A0ABR4P2R0_9HELO
MSKVSPRSAELSKTRVRRRLAVYVGEIAYLNITRRVFTSVPEAGLTRRHCRCHMDLTLTLNE